MLPKLVPYAAGMSGRYVEPFAGSAALFFALAPERAVLGDLNGELVRTYHAVVTATREVYDSAVRLPATRACFDALRRADLAAMSSIERAARFLFLNRYCFNGLYRTNLAGQFNVPFAPLRSGTFPNWSEFEAAASQLSRAIVVESDFASVISRYVGPGDFVYLDPPYAVENRRVFRQYTAQNFGVADLARLSDLLHCIDALGAKFLLSYAYSPEAIDFLGNWKSTRVHTHRNIAGFSKFRRRAVELLVSNVDI